MGKRVPESYRKDVQSYLCSFERVPIFKLSNTRPRKKNVFYTIDFGHIFDKIFVEKCITANMFSPSISFHDMFKNPRQFRASWRCDAIPCSIMLLFISCVPFVIGFVHIITWIMWHSMCFGRFIRSTCGDCVYCCCGFFTFHRCNTMQNPMLLFT